MLFANCNCYKVEAIDSNRIITIIIDSDIVKMNISTEIEILHSFHSQLFNQLL